MVLFVVSFIKFCLMKSVNIGVAVCGREESVFLPLSPVEEKNSI